MTEAERSRTLGLLLLAAVVIRLGAAWMARDAVPIIDEAAYDQVARSLLDGAGFATADAHLVNRGGGSPTSLWGCLHPLYVATVYALVTPAPIAVYVVNAFLGLVPLIVAFRMAGRLGGDRAAVVAGALVAFDVYLVRYSMSLLSETLYVTLLAVLLGLFARLVRVPGPLGAIAVGLVAGLSALTRGQAFYLALAGVAWLVIERRRACRPWRRDAVVVGLALIVTISPWVLRNRVVHDRPVFLDTKAGWNLHAYLHPDFDPWTSEHVPLPPIVGDLSLSESRLNQELRRRGLGFLRAEPLMALAKAPAKVYLMWTPLPTARTEPHWGPVKFGYLAILEGLALVGLARARLRTPEVRMILGVIVLTTLVHGMMMGGPRFRTPLDPALAVLAGLAVNPGRSGRTPREN